MTALALSPEDHARQLYAAACATGMYDPVAWAGALGKVPVTERAALALALCQHFEADGRKDEALALAQRAWNLGVRTRDNFLRLMQLTAGYLPPRADITFFHEAFLAAQDVEDADYLYEAAGYYHVQIYRAYEAFHQRPRYQDALLVSAAKKLLPIDNVTLKPREGRKLRLAYVLAAEGSPRYSSLPYIAIQLAEHHAQDQVEVTLISTRERLYLEQMPRFPDIEARVKATGCDFLTLPPPTGNSRRSSVLALAEMIRERDIDALILTSVTGESFALAAMRPAPLIGCLGLGEVDMYTSPLLDIVFSFTLWPQFDSLCDAVMVPPFMPDIAAPPEPTRLTRRDLDLPEDKIVIGAAAREVKFQTPVFWSVMNDVLQARPDVHLAIIGPERHHVDSYLNAHVHPDAQQRIHCLGWREDYTALMTLFDFMVDTFPNGGGYAATDAMRQGVPVLTCVNDVEDWLTPYAEKIWRPLPESLKHQDFCVSLRQRAAMTTRICALIDDDKLRHDLGRLAPEEAQSWADPKPTAAAIEAEIRARLDLIENPPPPPESKEPPVPEETLPAAPVPDDFSPSGNGPLILGFVGQNACDILLSTTIYFNRHLRDLGLATMVVDLNAPDVLARLGQVLQTQPVLFAYGYAGVGADLRGPQGKNLWDELRIPFLSLLFDHPFYIPERHKLDSHYAANCYFSQDFYDIQRRYVRSGQPLYLFPLGEPPTREPMSTYPYAERLYSLCYVKSGVDPEKIAARINQADPALRALIWQTVEAVREDERLAVADVAATFFEALKLDPDDHAQAFGVVLRLTDEYVRAWRATEMVKFLLPYPAALICGDGWDHIDRDGARAVFVPATDITEVTNRYYVQSRILVNTHPLIRDYLHERVSLALKLPACVLTDTNAYVDRHLADLPGVCAFSWRENWRERAAAFIEKAEKAMPDLQAGFDRLQSLFRLEPQLQAMLNAVKDMRAA